MGAAAVLIRKRRLLQTFLALGALSAETAVTLEELNAGRRTLLPFRQGFLFRRLEARGLIRATGDGRYWVDEAALEKDGERTQVIRLVLVALGIAVLLFYLLAAIAR